MPSAKPRPPFFKGCRCYRKNLVPTLRAGIPRVRDAASFAD